MTLQRSARQRAHAARIANITTPRCRIAAPNRPASASTLAPICPEWFRRRAIFMLTAASVLTQHRLTQRQSTAGQFSAIDNVCYESSGVFQKYDKREVRCMATATLAPDWYHNKYPETKPFCKATQVDQILRRPYTFMSPQGSSAFRESCNPTRLQLTQAVLDNSREYKRTHMSSSRLYTRTLEHTKSDATSTAFHTTSACTREYTRSTASHGPGSESKRQT